MKLRILSDLHLEFGGLALNPVDAEVIVLAGDIGVYLDGIAWAESIAERFKMPVVLIAGNHEFYRNETLYEHTLVSTLADLKKAAEKSRGMVHFLDDSTTVINGVRFIGSTLWTDFNLFNNASLHRVVAGRYMNDYKLIYLDGKKRFTTLDALHFHQKSVMFLREETAKPFAGKTVVVVHHVPSMRSVAERFQSAGLSAAYASNLDWLIEQSNAALFIHGHTHDSFDYKIGKTRVVCNPRGYAGYEVNKEFNPNLVIEI